MLAVCTRKSVCEKKFRNYKKFIVYNDLTVRDQAPSCNIYISCAPIRTAKRDSSLVGMQDKIVGCLIISLAYMSYKIFFENF